MTATDADRAKAAERAAYEVYLALPDAALDALTPHEEQAAITAIAAALAEARAPYDRLIADLRALAEELELAAELYDAAAMDGRIAGDPMAEGGHLIAAGEARRFVDRLRAVATATQGAIR